MSRLSVVKPSKPMSLESLSQLWLIQKEAEDSARSARIALEDKIAMLIPGPEEGTVNAETDGYKVKVVRKLTRSPDVEVYEEVKGQIPAYLSPVVYKPALDLKRLRAIETANPELYRICTRFLTVKPAKAAVTVEEVAR